MRKLGLHQRASIWLCSRTRKPDKTFQILLQFSAEFWKNILLADETKINQDQPE